MKAKENGIRLVAHAGEEEGATCVKMVLDTLEVERVDHGVRSLEDPELVKRLAKEKVPLTVCPLSNHRLQLQPRFFCNECPVRKPCSPPSGNRTRVLRRGNAAGATPMATRECNADGIVPGPSPLLPLLTPLTPTYLCPGAPVARGRRQGHHQL